MAQLKDTLIQGSARITDTLYANEINLGNVSASLPLFTDANKNFITKSAADTRTAIGVGASGTHADSYFVKAITSTDNNIPRFNSTAGQLQGSRMSINDNGLISLSYNGQYPGDIQYSNAAGLVGESWLDTGHATNVTSPRFYWRVRRPKSTAATTTETVYEQFRLPAATAGTEASKTYEIITTKNLSNITSVGTITSGTWQGTDIAAAYIGAHNHAAGDINSGTLSVARGGTGAGTFSTSAILIGNGTSAIQASPLNIYTNTTNDALVLESTSSASYLQLDAWSFWVTPWRSDAVGIKVTDKVAFYQQSRPAIADPPENTGTIMTITENKKVNLSYLSFATFNTNNVATEKASIHYDTTLHTLNFSVT